MLHVRLQSTTLSKKKKNNKANKKKESSKKAAPSKRKAEDEPLPEEKGTKKAKVDNEPVSEEKDDDYEDCPTHGRISKIWGPMEPTWEQYDHSRYCKRTPEERDADNLSEAERKVEELKAKLARVTADLERATKYVAHLKDPTRVPYPSSRFEEEYYKAAPSPSYEPTSEYMY